MRFRSDVKRENYRKSMYWLTLVFFAVTGCSQLDFHEGRLVERSELARNGFKYVGKRVAARGFLISSGSGLILSAGQKTKGLA